MPGEEGRELPPGVDDPSKVSEEQLRPIRTTRREGRPAQEKG